MKLAYSPRGLFVTHLLYSHGEITVFLSTFLFLLVAVGIGFWFGRLLGPRDEESSNLIQTAMLTLLSLLLAFGVSMAELRYEARKQGELDEANAISTSLLLSEFLSGTNRAEVGRLLERYLEKRIEFYQTVKLESLSSALQKQIWGIASHEARRKPTIPKGLFLTSLNQTFDLEEKQNFLFLNRVPYSIIALLCTASLIVMCLVGFLYARAPFRHLTAIITLALVISMTLFVILDLDRPRKGFIRVTPESLIRLQTSVRSKS